MTGKETHGDAGGREEGRGDKRCAVTTSEYQELPEVGRLKEVAKDSPLEPLEEV